MAARLCSNVHALPVLRADIDARIGACLVTLAPGAGRIERGDAVAEALNTPWYHAYHGAMPVVLRYKGFRFFFYSNEGSPRESMHVYGRGEGAWNEHFA